MMMAIHDMKTISFSSDILAEVTHVAVNGKPAWTHDCIGNLGINHKPARVFNRKQNSIINNTSQAYTVTNDL